METMSAMVFFEATWTFFFERRKALMKDEKSFAFF